MLLLSVVANVLQVGMSRAEVQEAGAAMERFEVWMKEHGRHYKDEAEKTMRFGIFMTNVAFIESFNDKGEAKYRLAVNQFADRTEDEFNSILIDKKLLENVSGMVEVSSAKSFAFAASAEDVPPSVDWREQGAVTPVKNQGLACASNVVFAAVATIESLLKIKTGNLTTLSEQYAMDCGEGDACKGQRPEEVYNSIKRAGGIGALSSSYPYVGVDCDSCDKAKASGPVVATIKDFVAGPSSDNIESTKALVARQPILAFVNAGSLELRFYSGGGMFDGICRGEYAQVVTLIGYGTEADGSEYWLVKNSWSAGWGMEGFGKIPMVGCFLEPTYYPIV